MNTPLVLVRLQETDNATARAQRKLDEMPEKQAILAARHKIAEVKDLRARTESFLRSAESAVKALEDETAGLNEKIDAEQKKILSGEITTAKELQNISRELDALKRRRDKLDEDTLKGMEKVEKAQGQLDKVDAVLKQLEAKEQGLVDGFKATGGALQKEIDKLGKVRSKLLAELEPDMRASYESLLKSKGGVAIGVLKGAHCDACRYEIPGTSLGELRAGADVATCPMCRRLLVVRCDEEDGD